MTVAAGASSRTSVTSCGSAALPRSTVSVTFDPGAPRSACCPAHTDISRVGAPLMARM